MHRGDRRPRPKPTLLLVDNNPKKLSRWSDAAIRAGEFDLITRDSPETAATALSSLEQLDVLVTDLCLTDESEGTQSTIRPEGLDVILHCRERFPDCRVVAITYVGGSESELGAMALECGANEFISGNWEYIRPEVLLEQHLRIFAKLWTRRQTAHSL
jgi:ActR/RegA family two-component response regulator